MCCQLQLGIKEHKKLFGFNPSLQYNQKGKGSAVAYRKPPIKKAHMSYWKKAVFFANSSAAIDNGVFPSCINFYIECDNIVKICKRD